jgi:hypothetical protein
MRIQTRSPCQKNQVIPKIPDQSVYYRRQMYIYNFTVCQGSSHAPLTKETVYSYVWLEHGFPKGSNQISSAIYHRLKSLDLTGICTIKLIADGCGGQNKNSMLMAMLSKFLVEDAPATLKNIKVIFPIVGHSFIPPDRVFGIIERDIKKHDTLLSDEDYISIFDKHATVVRLGEECKVYDWKKEVFNVVKKPANWHFKLQPCKRIVISRVKGKLNKALLRGEVNYSTNVGEGKTILKRGKKFKDLIPAEVKKGVVMKEEKVKDIVSLMEVHFSANWKDKPELSFLKDVISQQEVLQQQGQVLEEDADSDSGDIIEDEEVLPI